MRSRFLGVAVDIELHRRMHGTFGETYADVTVPDDGGEDLVLNGWTIDLKVTRADLHPNSWVFSKFQHESRKSGDRGYVFLRACPVWNSQDSHAKHTQHCLLYTSPSPRDGLLSRMPSSA